MPRGEVTPSALTAVLSALADDTRWGILTRLGRAPASSSTLAAELPISRQAVGKHVDVLRSAGLVTSEHRGREVVHRALGAPLSSVARELDAIAHDWDVALARIKRIAESGDPDLIPPPPSPR